jgi:probable F420-dependent oxidoreductase
MPDPLELLAFLAAASPTLTLGTAMVVAPLHAPAVLAKRAATVDRLSGGRLQLGLGIGWQREEYEAVGARFDDRGAQLEECIGAMRALWGEQPASFSGTYVAFDRVFMNPGPTGAGVPIVLGGHSDPAVRRAGRLAQGWLPFTTGPELFATQADLLRQSATEAGRPTDEVEITAWPASAPAGDVTPLHWARRYVDAGATRLLTGLRITAPDGLRTMADHLHRYREEVADRL